MIGMAFQITTFSIFRQIFMQIDQSIEIKPPSRFPIFMKFYLVTLKISYQRTTSNTDCEELADKEVCNRMFPHDEGYKRYIHFK